jgi:hypothetical protein
MASPIARQHNHRDPRVNGDLAVDSEAFLATLRVPSVPPLQYPGIRGRSSAGRALRSQCRGQGFDPPRLHLVRPRKDPGSGIGGGSMSRVCAAGSSTACGLRTEATCARAHRTRLAAGDFRPSPWLRRVPWTRSCQPAGCGIATCRSTPRDVVHLRRTVSLTSRSFTASRRTSGLRCA